MVSIDCMNKEIETCLDVGIDYVSAVEGVCDGVVSELRDWSGYEGVRRGCIEDVEQVRNKLLSDFDFYSMPAF